MQRITLIPSLLISPLFVFLSPSVVAAPLTDGSTAFGLSLAMEDNEGYLWVGTRRADHFLHDPANPASLGMSIRRERLEANAADLHISSTPGAGTCVEVIWNEIPGVKLHVL